jgi:hypothetical protein
MHGPLKSPFQLVRLFFEKLKVLIIIHFFGYSKSIYRYILYDHFCNTQDFSLDVMWHAMPLDSFLTKFVTFVRNESS